MNIAFCTEYLEPQINGIAVRCSQYIIHLRKLGNQVDVYGPKKHTLSSNSIHTVKNYFNKGNRLTVLPNLRLLINIFRKKYDAVHVVLPLFAWFPLIALATRISGTRLVLSNHVNLSYYTYSYLKNRLLVKICLHLVKKFYRYQDKVADLIMAPSKFDEIKQFISMKKFSIIKTAVDRNLFYPKITGSVHKQIIYVGRIAPEKNLDRLLDLFFTLDESFTLKMIGDGPELIRLKKRVQDNPRIQFLGFIPHSQLTIHFQNADFHLVTSLSETFGFTLIESMACGTPVIYPDCPVFDSLYGNDFPELKYKIDDNRSFLKSVDSLYENYEEFRKRSVEYSEKHSWLEASRSLMECYKWEKKLKYSSLIQPALDNSYPLR